MLSITAVSAGAIDYLLKGSGCVAHDHSSGAEQGAEAVAPGAEYLLAAASKEPAGVWFGTGLSMVGMVAGEAAREAGVRAVFGHLRHPSSTEQDPVFLGRAPRTFASVEERIVRAQAREPDAGEERRAEIAVQVRGDRRKAVGYYDLTFSPVKSVSVYRAALTSQGRHADAALVAQAHQEAIAEAMSWAEGEVSWTRVGYHGRTAAGRSVGRYEPGAGLVWTRWDHSTNRACEPQLHSHVAVLNRVVTTTDGQIRALDGAGFRAVKHGIDAIYAQAYELRLGAWLGVAFEWRPDGRAREILGIDPGLLIEASSRRRDVVQGAERLVTEYQERHGVEPSPAVRTKLARVAALSTRAAKSELAPGEQIRAWCAPRTARLAQALVDVAHRGRLVGDRGRDQRNQPTRSAEEILAAAVDAVQAGHATWDVGLLQKAIADELTRAPHQVVGSLPELTGRVLSDPARYGIVQVRAPDPVSVPVELQRADGKSVYRAHHDERYTTTTQLSTETALVIAARVLGAPAVAPEVAARLAVQLDSAGLDPQQVAAVVGIVSSGRAADVLIGPAGTGKSHTVGVLAETWRAQVGGRLLGLATSQIAALELGDNGLEAMNTTRFLTTFTEHDSGPASDRIQPGDLVVLDEVGMTSTAELARIAQVVTSGGGKLLYTGDHEQLAAIGAGGMLNLLVTDNGCFELSEVHRFTHGWERDASAGLRVGDTEVLEVYERHGRLVGGTVEDLTDTVVRAYLADTLTGHQSLLVVASNERATELSGHIRDELVRLGRVDPHVLAVTRDGNLIGVGDLIQARRNDPTIDVDGAGMVTNRLTYRVLGRDNRSGVLRALDSDGRIAYLPADYVTEHVTLAYASTVHAAQGRTVDTCHALIEPQSDRRSAYVALTRGREANTAYVVCERDPDGHLPERLASTARAQLASVISRVDQDTTQAAELARRAGIEEGRSLAWVITQWDLIAGDVCRVLCTTTINTVADPVTARSLLAEPGYPRLVRAVRAAQLAGHNPTAILTGAITERSLFGAESMTDVVRWRINIATNSRVPENDTVSGAWVAMTPPCAGPVGDYLTALAVAADDRQRELGHRALTEEPAWATTHLGAAPTDDPDRGEWVRRAGVIAAYRDLRALPDDTTQLGAAPPREQVLHRALWTQAHTAAARPADQLDYTTATETQLRLMRAAYERELAWAPYWVHDELRDAQLVAIGHHHNAVLWDAEARLLPPDTPERARADTDVQTAQQLADFYTARVEQLEVIDAARRQWHTDTEPARTRYEHAGDELARRGLPRDTTAPTAADQLPLPGLPATYPGVAASSTHTRHQELTSGAHDEPPTATNTGLQVPLFAATADLPSLAATSARRPTSDTVGGPGQVSVTLADARRHADISTELRTHHTRFTAALERLEHLTLRGCGHAQDEDYLRRSHDGADLDLGRDHSRDLDQGADYE